MSIGKHDEPVLEALSPIDVAAWLRARGFTPSRSHGKFGAVFLRERENEYTELILPTSAQVSDFARRMAELVDDLADAENRPSSEVLTDLTLAPFDVIRVRSPDADEYGSVLLNAGIDLHEEAQNLIASAASAAASIEPRRSYRGRRHEEVSDYLNNIRLGQTQRGSFILNVLSRHDFTPVNHGKLDLGDLPFGRRVTRKLASALSATEEALRQAVAGGIDPLIAAYRKGVSSNFYSALATLAREGDGIDVSLNWSPVSPEVTQPILRLRRDDAPILMEAAKALSQQEDEPDIVLEGMVSQISEKTDRFGGLATIETIFNGAIRRVPFRFSEEDRATVIQALDEKRWLQVTGDLRRNGRALMLQHPRNIKLLEVQDLDDLDAQIAQQM